MYDAITYYSKNVKCVYIKNKSTGYVFVLYTILSIFITRLMHIVFAYDIIAIIKITVLH